MRHGLKARACALVLCGCACTLAAIPAPAKAFEFRGGVGVGGIQFGTDSKRAVSPFAGLLWHRARDLLLEVHNMFSIVPGARVGAHGRTAVTLVYAWKTGKFSFGPSLAVYSMPVRGITICRVKQDSFEEICDEI